MSIKKIKTAAIYDRWLSTLGGGEQVVFAYAEILKNLGYQTFLLTHRSIDTAQAEQKMGINLEGINIKYLPETSSNELSAYTENYDLFINSSYLDYFPNRSKLGILSTFFPSQIFLSPFEFLKRFFIIPSFKSFFIYPLHYENFKYDEYKQKKIFKWLNHNSSLLLKNNVTKFKITLYFETLAFSILNQIIFTLNGDIIKPIHKQINHYCNTIDFQFNFPTYQVKNRFTIGLPTIEYADRIALIRLTIPSYRFFLYNVFKKFFPMWEMRLHGGPGVTKKTDLESYHYLITISQFCQKWIAKYWHLSSAVLYPPVNIDNFKASKNKNNNIIHVGRFFVTGHCKKQLEMIKQFKTLVQPSGKSKSKYRHWALHLVGSIQPGSQHHDYFMQCQSEAAGFPIYFHTDINFSELKILLAESKIYWHATGLDENEEKNPIVFEHFGITTVEAMASGCVPVVINAGGQNEIVTPGCGFVWQNRRQWIKYTKNLINDQKLLSTMSKNAIQRSKYFSKENFIKRFKTIIGEQL